MRRFGCYCRFCAIITGRDLQVRQTPWQHVYAKTRAQKNIPVNTIIPQIPNCMLLEEWDYQQVRRVVKPTTTLSAAARLNNNHNNSDVAEDDHNTNNSTATTGNNVAIATNNNINNILAAHTFVENNIITAFCEACARTRIVKRRLFDNETYTCNKTELTTYDASCSSALHHVELYINADYN